MSFCVWLTGKPCAGKTTLAQMLRKKLGSYAFSVTVLDGDEWRKSVAHDLGFTKKDRDENIRRVAAVAAYLVRDREEVVICAFVSPHEYARRYAEDLVGHDQFLLVEVHAPTETCEERDVKGMYAKARAGEIKGFTGVDDPYNPPLHADIVLNTKRESIEQSTSRILEALIARELL